jgi:hypothetical protein
MSIALGDRVLIVMRGFNPKTDQDDGTTAVHRATVRRLLESNPRPGRPVRHGFVCEGKDAKGAPFATTVNRDDEGVTWARGWDDEDAGALAAAYALRDST